MKVLASILALFITVYAGADEIRSSWRLHLMLSDMKPVKSDSEVVLMIPFRVTENMEDNPDDIRIMRNIERLFSQKFKSSGLGTRNEDRLLPGLSAFVDDMAVLGSDFKKYRYGQPFELFGQKGVLQVNANLTFTPKDQPSRNFRFSYGLFTQKSRLKRASGPGISFKF